MEKTPRATFSPVAYRKRVARGLRTIAMRANETHRARLMAADWRLAAMTAAAVFGFVLGF